MQTDSMWHDLGGVSNDAYEWLYFDVLDHATKAHVSIDFLAPNPFDPRIVDPTVDPRDRVGVITCISRVGQPGIEVDFLGVRTHLKYSDDSRLAIGDSSVTRRDGPSGLPIFEIELSSPAVDGSGRKVTGHFTFESIAAEWSVPGTRFYEAPNDPSRYHRWIVHAPRAVTTGHLTVEGGPEGRIDLDVSGHGYHDHNLGTVSLAATVQRWFWARGSDEQHTVIAAHLAPKAAVQDHQWLTSVVYVSSDTRNVVGSTGGENAFDLRGNTKGGNNVDYPAVVEVRTKDFRRQSVALAFKHQGMAIDTHPGYLRRYVDLAMNIGREQPSMFTAVAEDIVFP